MKIAPLPIARHAEADRSIENDKADVQIARLAGIYNAFEDRALSGDPVAANVCLKVIDRYIRILGLDKSPPQASAEINVTWADITAMAADEA